MTFAVENDDAPRGFLEAVGLLSAAVLARPAPSGLDDHLELIRSLEADTGAGSLPSSLALDEVVHAFELDETDTLLLATAALADLDLRAGAVLGALDGRTAYAGLSVGAAVEVLAPRAKGDNVHERLTAAGDLVAHGLLRVTGAGPRPLRDVRVADRLVDHLLEARSLDPDVEQCLVGSLSRQDTAAERAARALDSGVHLVHVRTTPGTAGLASALGAFERLGVQPVVVDLARRSPTVSGADVAAAAALEAALHGTGLVVVLDPAEDASALSAALAGSLDRAMPPVVLVGDGVWRAGTFRRPTLTVDATPLERHERERYWRSVVPAEPADAGPEWQSLVDLHMTPDDLAEAARSAVLEAGLEGRPIAVADLVHAAQRRSSAAYGTGARLVRPRARFADLELTPGNRAELDDVLAWARARPSMSAHPGLFGKGSKGTGLSALFTGGPGTGKTLAAEAVAGELGLDLLTVDLSAVIDKYIGETEKRLEQLLVTAELSNVVLFFDEADAIFGARTSVSDARDRYANQEVAFLLQRIEFFDGVVILASNLQGNIDKAFLRRFHHVVAFNEPDEETRARLWTAHLREVPRTDEADPVDVPWLAAHLEVSGGNIRNIVLAAAFRAAAEGDGVAVGMRHVRFAAHREYSKTGRIVPPTLRAGSPAATGGSQ